MSASVSTLGSLHEIVARELIKRIESGEATAADINNALKMLKDNGIEALPDKNEAIRSLASTLPVFTDDADSDDEYARH